MLASMTGYGKQIIERENFSITVEIRSVNNRFLDISLKLPRGFIQLEEKIKKIIKRHVSRGKIEVYISVNGQGNIQKSLNVDWSLMEQYMDRFAEIKKRYPIKGELDLKDLLKLEDVFTVDEEETEDETLKDEIFLAVEKSCQKLVEMRKTEGAYLEKDLLARLETLTDITDSLQSIRPKVIESYRERIKKRLADYLQEYGSIDDTRIVQEVAILAEKGDITEELTRLNSHIVHMRKTLSEGGSIGRKLDFICQEMHREANTIDSKSTASEINEQDVLLKSEIEKIKEQVQNIE